jgi:hypothetical protein
MIKGTIRLFNGHGLELKKAVYSSKMGKSIIIDRWKENNSSTFTLDKDAYLQIAPSARPHKVRKDGTNIQTRVVKKKESSIERPKAVYDNTDYAAKYSD